jgi:peptide-methionine (R)-S-oxide reductase
MGCAMSSDSAEAEQKQEAAAVAATSNNSEGKQTYIQESDAAYKQRLTALQYKVTRKHGTEPPRSSKLDKNKRSGVYACVCCSAPLFHSRHKFNSGTGWPSFDQGGVNLKQQHDASHGMSRNSIECAHCDAHLGHVFNDGPRKTTGKRYCINGASLVFNEGAAEPKSSL